MEHLVKRRKLTIGLLAAAVALTACGQEGNPTAPTAAGGKAAPEPSYPVAENVKVEGSPAFHAMTQRGRVVVGVKEDQPGLGFRDATTGEFSGFDIEIARMVAAGLGFGPPVLYARACRHRVG
jgi:glutamate transport system substrate-binding protein